MASLRVGVDSYVYVCIHTCTRQHARVWIKLKCIYIRCTNTSRGHRGRWMVCVWVVNYTHTCQHVCGCINIDAYISDACKSHTNISDA